MISTLFLLIAALGCVYLLVATALARPPAGSPTPTAPAPAVSILKPLAGAEPRLFENLATFCVQDYPAPVQIVCGVQDPHDPAIGVVERLQAQYPAVDLELVVDPTPHGANLKIANLINMAPHARHDVLVLADSDIAVEPSYLARLAATLAGPGVGAATCLYRGAAEAGLWSRVSALGIDAHFLPNALVGAKSGLATPCFGSTIALTRARLADIGGFAAFADRLADDYAIGAAVRALGLRVAIPDILVAHGCPEASLAELWERELRWARTIRSLDPKGYLGSFLTHPLGWAALAAATGAPAGGAILAALAILGRMMLLRALTRNFGFEAPAYRLLPLRDILSFAVFAWSFAGASLTWRGRRYHIRADGRLAAERETGP